MTKREQIEQRIAENERKIAEGERKQAPQEWEYTTAQNTTLETLNKLGKDGWRNTLTFSEGDTTEKKVL